MPDPRPRGPGLSTGTVIAIIAAFVLVGAPMVYYLWTTINELLVGRVQPGRVGLSIIILLIFLAVLAILSRSVRHLEERHL